MIEQQKRQIDFVFYHEEEIKEKVEEEREGYESQQNRNAISDPTANEAIRRLSEVERIRLEGRMLKYPERWLKVIEGTKSWVTGLRKEILERRYRKKENYSKSIKEMYISQSTYSKVLNEIRIYGLLKALQCGIMEI